MDAGCIARQQICCQNVDINQSNNHMPKICIDRARERAFRFERALIPAAVHYSFVARDHPANSRKYLLLSGNALFTARQRIRRVRPANSAPRISHVNGPNAPAPVPPFSLSCNNFFNHFRELRAFFDLQFCCRLQLFAGYEF